MSKLQEVRENEAGTERETTNVPTCVSFAKAAKRQFSLGK